MPLLFKNGVALLLVLLLFMGCQNGGNSGNTAKDTLTVMTYNIHHAAPPTGGDSIIDIPQIASAINEVKPDLVALQEIDVHTRRSGKEMDEARKLAQLTGMQAYFTKTLDYDSGQYGIAVLSRFPLEDSIGYLLPIATGVREETRAVCIIKVSLPGDQPLYFASTHLGLSKETRLLQAGRISTIIQNLQEPVILGGDFNSTPGSETINKLSSFMQRSCTSDCASTFPYDQPREKIDFVFYTSPDRLKPIDQNVLTEFRGSDHLPVVVRFKIR